MTPSPASRLKTIFLGIMGLLLSVQPGFSAEYASGVTAKLLKKTTVTDIGGKITYPRTDRAEVTAMTVELAPGAETGWHSHPVPVFAYVMTGDLSIALEDGSRRTYHAGDAVIEAVDTLHNGRNAGTEPVRMAVFYLGVEGAPVVVKVKPGAENGQQAER